MPDYDQIKERITKIQDTGVDLSKWEEDFVRSVIGQYKQRGWLSDKQIDIIDRIYLEKCPRD